MREPLARGAWYAQLLGAVFRVRSRNRVTRLLCGRRAEVRRLRVQLLRRLHPDLADRRLRPHREQADAVAALEDRVQVSFQPSTTEAARRRTGGARTPEPRRATRWSRGRLLRGSRRRRRSLSSPRRSRLIEPSAQTSSSDAIPAANDWFLAPEPCVPVAIAPPTEMCGSDARFGNARPWRLQRAAQVAVADPGLDRDRLVPDLDDAVEVFGREEYARRVSDEAEGMACAERPDRLGLGDHLLRLGHRPRPQDPARRVGDVPSPVLHERAFCVRDAPLSEPPIRPTQLQGS